MASFSEHINQAKNNISFLEIVNQTGTNWDWQVTVCFYTAVHLVNAHIAQIANGHYRTHEEVERIISPYTPLSPCQLPEDVFSCYIKLSWLSRRSRYLISENKSNNTTCGQFTYDVHFAKSIRHLDKILSFFIVKYNIQMEVKAIKCMEIRDGDLLNFKKCL